MSPQDTVSKRIRVLALLAAGAAALSAFTLAAERRGGHASPIPLGALDKAHEASRRLQCRNNLKQIGLALDMYRRDHDGKFPKDLETLIEKKYITNRKTLQCPSARSPYGSVDYILVRTEGTTFDSGDIIVYDRKGNHEDGRNVLQFDGHVRWLSEKEFTKRMGRQTRSAEK